MGRFPTGVMTTQSAERIELKYLLKHGLIQKGYQASNIEMSWNSGNEIKIETCYSKSAKYIRLMYHRVNEERDYDYKIQLTTVPSNLGKGEILYFICPVSGKRCKVLYRAYGCNIWKSREAYQVRIYYNSQINSAHWHNHSMYRQIINSDEFGELIEKHDRKYAKTHYKGKPTKWVQRHLELLERVEDYQQKSDIILFPYLEKHGLEHCCK